MMKRILIASAIAVSLVSATGAPAHDDKHHVKKEERPADGHAAALGKPGDPLKVTRSVEVEMNDTMRFRPDSIRVKRGETIRFVVRNTGKVKHEMVLGTIKELKEHAEMMRKFPEMVARRSQPGQRRARHDRRTGLAIHQGRARSISPAWCRAISRQVWSARFRSAADAQKEAAMEVSSSAGSQPADTVAGGFTSRCTRIVSRASAGADALERSPVAAAPGGMGLPHAPGSVRDAPMECPGAANCWR